MAFGIASVDAGLEVWQASAYSLLVFAGSAQFAAVEVIGDGGSAASAIAAGLLLNVRSLAFGVVVARDLTGPWWKRAAWSQLVIDETTAVASAQPERRWRRYGFLWTGLTLFTVWNLSTLVGAAGLSSVGDLVTDWGIDATIPAVFLALLWPRLAEDGQRRSALAGALIAVALVPVAPPGVPILAAALGILAAWRPWSAATTTGSRTDGSNGRPSPAPHGLGRNGADAGRTPRRDGPGPDGERPPDQPGRRSAPEGRGR